jgi:cGMP-dependent protein kinase
MKMFYCEVEKGAYVFRQNDQASCFFIIHEGEVTVEINKQDKQDKKILKKKACFGDLALMYNATRSASIFANQTTRFWAIDRRTFKKVVEEVATNKFKENREFIEKVPFFDSMTEGQKDAVTMVLLTQIFKKGQTIINEGDQAASYYIIKDVN